MTLPRSPFLPVAFVGLGVWLSFAARPLAAEEAATVIPAPAVRAGAVESCRIVMPNFAPDREKPADATRTRFAGGAQLTLPVATPCPARSSSIDV